MNFFSYEIRSLLHQDHRDPHAEFSRHRDNGDSGSYIARMPSANRAEKFPKLSILSDRRPGGLDELTSKPSVSAMCDRSAIGSLSGRILRGHQPQKPCQFPESVPIVPTVQ